MTDLQIEPEELHKLPSVRTPARARWLRIGPVFVSMLLIAGAVAAATTLARSENSAEASLAAAQAFIEENQSFRLSAVIDDEWGSGERSGPGSWTTDRSEVTAEIADPDTWHLVSDSGDWSDETTRIGDTVWVRSSDIYEDSDTRMEEMKWVEMPSFVFDFDPADYAESIRMTDEFDDEFDDEFGDWMLGDVPFIAEILTDSPSGVLDLIAKATEPEVVSRSGEVMVLRVAPDVLTDLMGGVGDDLEAIVELSLGADQVPTELNVNVRGEDSRSNWRFTFTDWGAPMEIAAPSDAEIDQTPWIEEETVLAFDAFELLAPLVVPDGLELSTFWVLPAEETPEGCEQLNLSWYELPESSEEWMTFDDGDYLDIYELSTECADDPDASSTDDFSVIPFPDMEDSTSIEVRIGDVVVQIDTNLDEATLATVIDSLVPADVPAMVDRFNERAQQLMDDGFPPGF